ncbi:MAG: hypothetical protein Q7R34_05460 [Dehalococcoidia bacterium]|nr:hypothetical protein [Dehalococcoidia bacterium]
MAKDNFVHTLMKPSPNKAKDRSVWGLPLNGLWIPFFTATNTVGESHINAGALGCPLRLAVGKDGVPKLKDDGMPRYTVDKEISTGVRVVKDNFAFGLMAFVASTQKAMPTEYKAQVEAAQKAGAKVLEQDQTVLDNYLAELEAVATEAAAKTQPPTETHIESKDRELVAA